MAPRIVVVGLGPSGPDLVSPRAIDLLGGAERRYLRTRWHPAAVVAGDAESFDDLYESTGSFDEVYAGIVEALVAAAERCSPGSYVAYGVPGSPLVAEKSVAMLRADSRVEVEVEPALGFLDLAWHRLSVDPVATGVRIVDGAEFAVEAAGERGPLLVAQCWSKEILSEVKLAAEGAGPVIVLQRLGGADEAVFEVEWDDLDRKVEPDHMTSLWIPAMAAPVAAELLRLDELVRTLRERCPWDRKQTHRSLTKHLIEEAYEVLDAIGGLPEDPPVAHSGEIIGAVATAPSAQSGSSIGDAAFEHLEEELGDLLFQVLFHARLAAEEGHFTVADVARRTHDKLVARHPHVFGEVIADTPEAVVSNWEQIKKEEKGRSSIMEGIPSSLPALAFAYNVQKKAASVGFDWPDPSGPFSKVDEEVGELRQALSDHGQASSEARSELGDLLFTLVNLARHLGIDPEIALRQSAATFRLRFEAMEAAADLGSTPLGSLSLEELDRLWEEAKGELADGAPPLPPPAFPAPSPGPAPAPRGSTDVETA